MIDAACRGKREGVAKGKAQWINSPSNGERRGNGVQAPGFSTCVSRTTGALTVTVGTRMLAEPCTRLLWAVDLDRAGGTRGTLVAFFRVLDTGPWERRENEPRSSSNERAKTWTHFIGRVAASGILRQFSNTTYIRQDIGCPFGRLPPANIP